MSQELKLCHATSWTPERPMRDNSNLTRDRNFFAWHYTMTVSYTQWCWKTCIFYFYYLWSVATDCIIVCCSCTVYYKTIIPWKFTLCYILKIKMTSRLLSNFTKLFVALAGRPKKATEIQFEIVFEKFGLGNSVQICFKSWNMSLLDLVLTGKNELGSQDGRVFKKI